MSGGYDVSVSMTLIDNVSKNLRAIETSLRSVVSQAEQFNKVSNLMTTTTDHLNNELKETKVDANSAKSGIDSLKQSVKNLASAYLGLQTAKKTVSLSDNFTLQTAKLSQITDDVEAMQDEIYKMSQDSRSDYMTNMSQIAKMGVNTQFGTENSVFADQDELIAFNELLNKTFILGGSGFREMNASVYQLTQALSSGRLQGDELRSLIENAPMYANAIVDYMNEYSTVTDEFGNKVHLTIADIRELGSQGLISSEIMKNALLASAEDIRDAYEKVPLTFEQVWTKLKNQMTKIAEPILKTINDIINSEAFEKTTQSIVKMFAVVMAVLSPILKAVMAIGEFVADNWKFIEPVVFAIVGALVAWLLVTTMLTLAEKIHAGWIVLKTGLIKLLGAALLFSTGATWGQVVATYGLAAPIILIIGIIIGVIGVIYALVQAYNHWTGSSVSAIGFIVGVFWTFFSYLYNNFTVLWNFIVSIVEFFANVWTNPVYSVKKLFGSLAKSIINVMLAIVSPIDSVVTGIVNSVVEGINWVLGLVNDVVNGFSWALSKIGIDAGTIDLGIKYESKSVADDLTGVKNSIDDWIGEEPDNYKNFDDWRLDPKDLGEAWDEGYSTGAGWGESIGGLFEGLMNPDDYIPEGYNPDDFDAAKEYADSQKGYDPNDTSGGDYSLPKDLEDAIKNLDGNVEDIKDITQEDLKYLRDLAEQKVINRFTTAEIRIDNHMNNNINSDRDLDGIVTYLTDEMYKAARSTAEGLHY